MMMMLICLLAYLCSVSSLSPRTHSCCQTLLVSLVLLVAAAVISLQWWFCFQERKACNLFDTF